MPGQGETTIRPQPGTYAARDGARLALRTWRPAGGAAPRGHVVFLHGIISHGGWYTASCSHLAQAGLAVQFLERRGSGLNLAARGDIDDWTTWIDDVAVYLERISGALPTALCGISWGGKLAAAVARERQDLVQRLALICPGIYAYQQPGAGKQLLLRLAARGPLAGRRVRVPLADPALFTDSPQWQEFIRTDPDTLRRITLRFAREDLRLTEYVRAEAERISVPTMLMLAGRDRIVDNKRMREFFGRLGASEKKLIEYSGGHTLEFEDEPQGYFDDLEGWLG